MRKSYIIEAVAVYQLLFPDLVNEFNIFTAWCCYSEPEMFVECELKTGALELREKHGDKLNNFAYWLEFL